MDLPTGQIFMRFRKNCFDVVSLDPKHGQYLIPIENIMDGESIGKQIYDVVEKNFPHLLNK
ncbi:phosphotransferase enzyme II, B component [Salmonella enterica subsp. enterica serovar Daytona]|uniref:Phosphotransferase enzyme II, B component n=1 Tax=Salmonella enterica subsp. enterica serovar Daytona TaxID=1962639 RepID=A0A447JKD7_SALET|nr:phosphotransferase enzyme II, B component [Salmonella enterica subsp. enterica serovar Daytona]